MRGLATIFAIAILLMVAVGQARFSASIRDVAHMRAAIENDEAADIVSRDALRQVVADLRQHMAMDAMPLDGTVFEVSAGGQSAQIRIRPESSKLDIAQVDTPVVKQVLRRLCSDDPALARVTGVRLTEAEAAEAGSGTE